MVVAVVGIAVIGAVAVVSITTTAAGAGAGAAGAGAAGAATTGVTAAAVPAVGGLILLGAEQTTDGGLTWDCWKPILRDLDTTRSNGRRISDVLEDDRVASFESVETAEFGPLVTRITNKWNERFDIVYFRLENGTIAAHAQMI